MLRILIAGGALLASCAASAEARQYDWTLEDRGETREAVTRYSSDVDGQAIDAFRGVAEVPYSMPAVLAAILDTDGFRDWIFGFKTVEKRPIADEPTSLYLAFHATWPAKDRDVVVVGDMDIDVFSGVVQIHSRHAPEAPERSGHVRIEELDNRWILTPLDNGWTRIDFRTFVDIGGWVPGWLANMVATDTPYQTLEGLRKRLDEANYRFPHIEDIPFLPEGNWFNDKTQE
ncbi:conserved hypothetical protein [gamma proteobacterium HTCC5015]|nr:conserved hypothetical protein [gamma proteobacterium HTCC5015]